MLKCGIHFAYNYLYIHSVRILHTNYIHNVCDEYLLWIRVDVNVYAIHTKYTPHFDKLSHTFCIQNSAAIFLLILYTKFMQKFVETRYTFCIHQLHTSCKIFVCKMNTQFLCGAVLICKEIQLNNGCNLRIATNRILYLFKTLYFI